MIILNAGNEVGRFACENLAIMLWCCGGGVWFCIPVLRPIQPLLLLRVGQGPNGVTTGKRYSSSDSKSNY